MAAMPTSRSRRRPRSSAAIAACAAVVLAGVLLLGGFTDQVRINSLPRSLAAAETPFLPLAFLHLPKTGGTSLWSLLHARATAAGLNPDIKGRPNEPGHDNPTWTDLTRNERDSIDVFGSNHINFCTLHETWSKAEKAQFVTVLRDPRQRLASHYFFVKSWGEEHYHPSYQFVSNRTFAEFVRDVKPGYYLQFLLCPDEFRYEDDLSGKELRLIFDQGDETALEKAKALLREGFEVVGILEKLEETEVVLSCKVPWMDDAHMDHLRQTPHDMPEFDEADMVKATWLDQELYEYGRELLREKYLECAAGMRE